MIYERRVFVDKEQADRLQSYLDMEEVDFDEIGEPTDSTIASFGENFGNGIFADINVCSGQHNFYIDAVLFDEGSQCNLLDCSETLLDRFEFDYDGVTYVVILDVEEC